MEQIKNTTELMETTNDERSLPKSSDIEISENEIDSAMNDKNKNVLILPKTTSNRNRRKMKQKTNYSKRSKKS